MDFDNTRAEDTEDTELEDNYTDEEVEVATVALPLDTDTMRDIHFEIEAEVAAVLTSVDADEWLTDVWAGEAEFGRVDASEVRPVALLAFDHAQVRADD